MLPLLIAVTIAHAFTVLTLRRSILTEKVSRRGYHLTREYSIDPLEILFVREVVRGNIVAFSASSHGAISNTRFTELLRRCALPISRIRCLSSFDAEHRRERVFSLGLGRRRSV
jgi:hypothetical protein